jgi:predicted dehydrogenase/threonine dehydrogenase-like Zn-dependent dehydrogenase
MQQIFQNQRSGSFRLDDVPAPACRTDGILVAVQASLISSGTERRKAELGGKSLLEKARARPDLVAQVIDRARVEGLSETVSLVRERLDAPQPLGYSAAGTIVEAGPLVTNLTVGQPVAIAGAGFANHAEVCSVPANLAAAIPDGVDPAHACFATVGAIALQGIRQAAVTPGETVAVIGLGLVGHLTTRLLHAYGHPVVGIDVSQSAIQRADGLPLAGGWAPDDPALLPGIAEVTHGRGVDAVIVTAATPSNDPVRLAARLLRDRGRIVVVGDVGLALERTPLYEKELDLRLSRSYGPGRYDRAYEEHGVDYPVGYVRWTEQRNLAEVVRLLATGRLQVDDLITHRYAIDQAVEAYRTLVDPQKPSLAIVLSYPMQAPSPNHTIPLEAEGQRLPATTHAISMLGAGNFASRVLIPALRADGRLRFDTVVTRSGATASHLGRRAGFARCSSDAMDALDPTRVQAVVIATRHDSHSELAAKALEAGLAVFVEKPLAIDQSGLERVTAALEARPGTLLVGFNRRFAGPTQALLQALPKRTSPGLVNIRVAAGALPDDHWVLDQAEGGGRIVGEVCHFLDLANFLLGQAPAGVYAKVSDAHGPQSGNVSIIVDYPDQSTAVVQYHAVGGKRMPKELVEAAWDGASARIDDFRILEIWGSGRAHRQRWRRQDKGHRQEVAAFVDWVLDGTPAWKVEEGLSATATTLAVLRSLETGQRVEVVSASPEHTGTSPTGAPGDPSAVC